MLCVGLTYLALRAVAVPCQLRLASIPTTWSRYLCFTSVRAVRSSNKYPSAGCLSARLGADQPPVQLLGATIDVEAGDARLVPCPPCERDATLAAVGREPAYLDGRRDGTSGIQRQRMSLP